MSDAKTIEFLLWMEDSEADAEALRAMTKVVAGDLEENRDASVSSVSAVSAVEGEPGRVPKGGDSGGSILNVEINLENIVAFGKWLYGRVAGTSTKAKFEYQGATFEFDGRNAQELAVVMDEFQQFVAAIDASKKDAPKP